MKAEDWKTLDEKLAALSFDLVGHIDRAREQDAADQRQNAENVANVARGVGAESVSNILRALQDSGAGTITGDLDTVARDIAGRLEASTHE